MKGYNFESVIFNANQFGEIEARQRVCVVAISDGLPNLNLSELSPPDNVHMNVLSDFLEDIPSDSALWRKMEHVKIKDKDPKFGYKNMLYKGNEELIASLTASYAAPKAGSPMVAHPSDSELQRQITVAEHSAIRRLPPRMSSVIMGIENGCSPVVSAKGSTSMAHRLLGNGVSKKLWNSIGEYLGKYMLKSAEIVI